MTKKYPISAAFLKNVAYLTMFIDHFFVVVFVAYMQWRTTQGFSNGAALEIYHLGRDVGRIAFVLFAFMTAEGFCHTHSRKQYLLRLGFFAFLSEIPFDLAINGKLFETDGQNVYFTLFLGVLALCFLKSLEGYPALQIISITLCCVAAAFLGTDYMFMGVLLIVVFYLCRESFLRQLVMGAVTIYFGIVLVYMVRHMGEGIRITVFLKAGLGELYGLLAFVFIYFYNGQKGKQLPKAFYYLFYPMHLLLLYGMRQWLFG